jgi:hypothetical protein
MTGINGETPYKPPGSNGGTNMPSGGAIGGGGGNPVAEFAWRGTRCDAEGDAAVGAPPGPSDSRVPGTKLLALALSAAAAAAALVLEALLGDGAVSGVDVALAGE